MCFSTSDHPNLFRYPIIDLSTLQSRVKVWHYNNCGIFADKNNIYKQGTIYFRKKVNLCMPDVSTINRVYV